MVYVVERYLPGLSRSDLLHGLARLERAGAETRSDPPVVRYLGSTIVLGDEACFCEFEGPSEAAVAEANRKAGLPFDRIVPALTVKREGSTTMTVSPSIPYTIEIRRSRLLGLVVAVALAAAALTWALLDRVIDTGTGGAQGIVAQAASVPAIGPSGEAWLKSFTSASAGEEQYVQGVTSLTPDERAAAFGSQGSILNALGLGPREMQYVQGVTSLTPIERAAAFGGQDATSRR